MTIDRLEVGLGARSHRVFRLAVLVCAALLGMQCIWLLLPELFRPRIDRLPTDAPAAAAAAKHRDAARWAASFAGIRGDLWADFSVYGGGSLMEQQGSKDRRVSGGIIGVVLALASTTHFMRPRTAPALGCSSLDWLRGLLP